MLFNILANCGLTNIYGLKKEIINYDYGLKNVFENDFDALLARIKFVQDREPTSLFIGF